MLLLGAGVISPGKYVHRPKHPGFLQRDNLVLGGLGFHLNSAPLLLGKLGSLIALSGPF